MKVKFYQISNVNSSANADKHPFNYFFSHYNGFPMQCDFINIPLNSLSKLIPRVGGYFI